MGMRVCAVYVLFFTLLTDARGKTKYKLPGLKNYIAVVTRPKGIPLDLSTVGLDVNKATALKFYVRTCTEARLLLHPSPDSRAKSKSGNRPQNSAEIILGQHLPRDNVHVSYMRRCRLPDRPECHPTVVYPVNPLHCFVLKPFWITWARSKLRFGWGKLVGRHQLMKISNYTSDPFDRLLVASGTKAYWMFPPDKEPKIIN